MVARTKQEKAVHVARLLDYLWHGRTDAALTYFRHEVQAKNLQQLAALVTHLEKHRAEIIDYGRRQRADKPVGSSRIEKGFDQVIGARQKHKGMSWSYHPSALQRRRLCQRVAAVSERACFAPAARLKPSLAQQACCAPSVGASTTRRGVGEASGSAGSQQRGCALSVEKAV
jgi:hypothetical protein